MFCCLGSQEGNCFASPVWWRFLFWAVSTPFLCPDESQCHLPQHSLLWRSLSGVALTLVTWSRQNGLVPAPLRGRLVKTDTKARIIITLNAIWHCYVMEWSGSCCRYPTSHLGKWETTAGNVQQQQDFYFADQTSTNTTDTRSQTYTVSAGRRESKQTVQSIRSSKQPNQQNLCFLGSLQLQISLWLHNKLSQIRYQMKAYTIIFWTM